MGEYVAWVTGVRKAAELRPLGSAERAKAPKIVANYALIAAYDAPLSSTAAMAVVVIPLPQPLVIGWQTRNWVVTKVLLF